jgi:zinc protease
MHFRIGLAIRTVALGLLLASAVLAPSSARAERALTLPRSSAVHFTLKNGLKVVLEPMPDHPFVATVVAYEAGWAHDPPGHSGLAHLVEHLTYRGSRHLPGQGIFEHLEAVGSPHFNGTTNQDLAYYHAVVPAEHFALPLWIESERMAFTLENFKQQALDLERQRVKKEILQRQRVDPTFSLFINQALYSEGHPYRVTNAEIDDVLAVDLLDASWFFQTHYRPDNAYLVLVGGFPARAASVVLRYFSPIVNPPGVAPGPRTQRREFKARETLVVEQPVYVDNQLVMVFPAPEAASDESPAFDLLFTLLSGHGPWSLEDVIVTKAALAEWLDLELVPGKLGSTVRIHAQLRHGVPPERAEVAIETYLGRLARFDDERTLKEIRTALAVSAVSRLSDPLESAMAHLAELRASGRPFDLATDFARMRRSTASDVARVARRFLDPKRRLSARLVEGSRACFDGCVSHEVDEK